jgi:Arc-like DNA binding domain
MRKTYKIKLTPEAARVAQFKLRVPWDLRTRLLQAADSHGRTINAELRLRLEDSFEQGAHRNLEEICTDLRTAWGRFSARFLRMELADQLADAVMQNGDAARIRTLAQLIIEHRVSERRGLGGVS